MMQLPTDSQQLPDALRSRREQLAKFIDFPAILWSGGYRSRNFTANTYPFRASSHFLYFAGLPLENAVIRLEGGKMELFIDEPPPSYALWHGEMPKRETIAESIWADAAFPLAELASRVAGAATILIQDPITQTQQFQHLNRAVHPPKTATGIDLELIKAIIALRLSHDQAALTELRLAAQITVEAHKAGMAVTPTAKTEAEVRAEMEKVITSHNTVCSYSSIVTVHGQVLHHEKYFNPLQTGDLLLADVGAETAMGWAADITRTWPVSGQFSSTQRDIYEVVLDAHDTCIEQMKPGVEYREIHLLAALKIAEGLVNLGILKGQPSDLVEQDAHALFFPHGIGHLLGLDVHDMEDLGDLAGYTEGRIRSERFGLGYLRLNRPLQAGMLVTIEPGFYQVPAILQDEENREKYQEVVNWEKLKQFADVRGIRIEDDVLITETGTEVLTANLPNQASQVEALVQSQ